MVVVAGPAIAPYYTWEECTCMCTMSIRLECACVRLLGMCLLCAGLLDVPGTLQWKAESPPLPQCARAWLGAFHLCAVQLTGTLLSTINTQRSGFRPCYRERGQGI